MKDLGEAIVGSRLARICGLFLILSAAALAARCSSEEPRLLSGTGGAGGGVAGAPGSFGGSTGAGGDDAGTACSRDARPVGCGYASSNSHGGVACNDVLYTPMCVDGAWVCQNGTVADPRCTCYYPQPQACSVCTASGWVCLDAGTDAGGGGADGGGAGDAGSISCGGAACAPGQSYCFEESFSGGGVGGGPGGGSTSTTRSCNAYPTPCAHNMTCACLCAQVCPQTGGGAQVNCSCDSALARVTCEIAGV